MVFFPGARAIHDRGKTTAPYPVRFALAQQRSVLYYWSKYHGFFGRLGIRSIMMFHHLMRYALAVLSGFRHSHDSAQSDVKKQVSSSCLRELVFGSAPQKA